MAAFQGSLNKSDIFPGAILWLDNNADNADRVTYGRSELTRGALDHPVLVVDTLGDNHGFLWMTGTSNAAAGDIPVAFSSVFRSKREAIHCDHCGKTHVYDFAKPSDMLHHDSHSAKMCKPTHVRATRVYEVSMRMLRLERSCTSVSDWTIDRRSLLLVLELSEKDRCRLAASSHAVRTWPLAPIVDFSQSDPPYPGSKFNPKAGTYSGFPPDVEEPRAGPMSALTSKENNNSGVSSSPKAHATKIIPASAVQVDPMSSTKVSSVKASDKHPKAKISDASGVGHSQTPSVKSTTDTSKLSSSQLPSTNGTPATTSGAALANSARPRGLLKKLWQSISNLAASKEEKTTGRSYSTSSATISAQDSLDAAPKGPTIKLDPIPVGVSIMQKASEESSLTKEAAGVESTSSSTSEKAQVQVKQPAATVPNPKLPAFTPTHPFKAGHIVWISRREYEGENDDPLEHLKDVSNRPACVISSRVPGRPDHVSICGITTFAGFPLGNVLLSELKKGHYLAIATSLHPNPAGPHKVNLVGDKSMPRETRVSYINVNKRYTAPAKVLDKMRESRALGDHQLDKEGVKKLKEVRAMAVAAASRL